MRKENAKSTYNNNDVTVHILKRILDCFLPKQKNQIKNTNSINILYTQNFILKTLFQVPLSGFVFLKNRALFAFLQHILFYLNLMFWLLESIPWMMKESLRPKVFIRWIRNLVLFVLFYMVEDCDSTKVTKKNNSTKLKHKCPFAAVLFIQCLLSVCKALWYWKCGPSDKSQFNCNC